MQTKKGIMIKDKDTELVETNFLSDVLGGIGVYKRLKIWMMKK